MNILLRLNYYDLAHLAPLYTALYERYPTGWVWLRAVYETDQEQEADERGMWKHGGTPRPAREWQWMEYGVFNGVGSTLYTKLYLRKLIDEGTGSTFNALESRGFITCKYTWKRRDGDRESLE